MLTKLFFLLVVSRALVALVFFLSSGLAYGTNQATGNDPLLTKYNATGELSDNAENWDCVLAWTIVPDTDMLAIDKSFALMVSVFIKKDGVMNDASLKVSWSNINVVQFAYNSLGFCGYKDWGIPGVMLNAGMDYVFNTTYFPSGATYWTSKEYEKDKSMAYIAGNGIDETNNVRLKTELHSVRMFRIYYQPR